MTAVAGYPESNIAVKERDDISIRAFREQVTAHVEERRPLVDVRSPKECRGERLHMPEYPNEGALQATQRRRSGSFGVRSRRRQKPLASRSGRGPSERPSRTRRRFRLSSRGLEAGRRSCEPSRLDRSANSRVPRGPGEMALESPP